MTRTFEIKKELLVVGTAAIEDVKDLKVLTFTKYRFLPIKNNPNSFTVHGEPQTYEYPLLWTDETILNDGIKREFGNNPGFNAKDYVIIVQ